MKKRVALVLAGGAARGAYEVGVVQHVVEEVAATLGHEIHFDILCGTSVGALNACGMAAWAHEGRLAIKRMLDVWQSLELDSLVRTDVRGVLSALRLRSSDLPATEGGILDPRGIEQVVHASIPFEKIDENLADGFLSSITVSTTHVTTGHAPSSLSMQTPDGKLPPWSNDPTIEPRAAKIRAQHALASAAIPILFRSVRIDSPNGGSEFHCDGGLRQNVPLSPARRLGADAVLVINPRFLNEGPKAVASEEAFPGPLFLLGKTLNALLLDRIDTDLARLESVNRILDAGARAFGPEFVAKLNVELGHKPGHGLRPMRALLVRASADIGALAAEFVREHSRAISGLTGRLIRRLASNQNDPNESDLLSYVLFDGRFAKTLIDLGRRDAAARHDELCEFFRAMTTKE